MKKKYIVEDVCQKKTGVLLSIQGDEYLLSTDDYLEGLYYPGKELSLEDMKTLKKNSRQKKAKDYLLRLLSERRYTRSELKIKLEKKYMLSEIEADEILSPYIENHLIDDEAYMKDYLETKIEQGYGRNYLLAQLQKKGISPTLLSSIPKELQDQDEILFSLIEKMNRTQSSMTQEKKKESIFLALLRRGFSSSQAKKAIEEFYSTIDKEEIEEEKKKRKVLLKKEAEKCYNFLRAKKDATQAKKKDAFIRKLLQKGFHYDEIEAIMKEYTFI